jgi:hypothetical protein
MTTGVEVPRVIDLQTAIVVGVIATASDARYARVYSGAGTPAATETIPSKIGDIYVDTTNHKMYIAEAAAAATDFIILN